MFGGFFSSFPNGGFFDQNFRAYPVAFIEKDSAEKGDKVILPPSALQTLASMHVEYPMLFRVENKRQKKHSHCGVLEFVAQEGMCYMPQWMMDNLLLGVGDLVNLRNVSLPKGTFIKIQPHSKDFLDISNPKAVLETSLRSFTCLTEGDTFCFEYNGMKYYIDVMEVKPAGAVSVIETDLSVDFAPPKDYVEPPPPQPVAPLRGTPVPMPLEGGSGRSGAAPAEPDEPTFVVFGGRGHRIDGKSAALRRPGEPSARTCCPPENAQATADSAPAAGISGKTGKRIFEGGGGGAPYQNRLLARLAQEKQGSQPKARPPPPPEEPPAKPKFSAFAGKGRSLKD